MKKMGCNCKASKQIVEIHKNYGAPTRDGKTTDTVGSLKLWGKKRLMDLGMIILMPFALIFVLLSRFRKDKVVPIHKIVKYAEQNVRAE